MQALMQRMNGTKTYGLAVLLALLAAADVLGLIPDEQRTAIYSVIVAGLAAALRHGIARLPEDQQAKLARARELVESIREQIPPRETNSPPIEDGAYLRSQIGYRPDSHKRHLAGAGLLLLCLLIPVTASASDIRIVGPAAVPVAGCPCELFVQGDLPAGTKITWDYFPKAEGFPLVDSADRHKPVVRLNTMAGAYKLIVSVTPPGDEAPVIRYHDFSVPGSPYTPPTPPAPTPQPQPPGPQPQPPPQPQPQPVDPTFDVGQFGFAEATYRAAIAVNSPQRKSETVCLATKLAAIVNGIDTDDPKRGTIQTAQQAANSLGAAFDGCLSEAWNDTRDRLADRVSELITARRLTTMQHWKTLATEALQGLNAAAVR